MTIAVNNGSQNLSPVLSYNFREPRSYIGPAITNILDTINPHSQADSTSGLQTPGYMVSYIPSLGSVTHPYVEIKNQYPSVSSDCCPSLFNFNSNTFVSASPSTLYTFGIVYKCDSGYTHQNFMYKYEWDSSQAYIAEGGHHTMSQRVHLGGGWYWAWGTFTTRPNTAYFTYPSLFYYQYGAVWDRVSVAKVLLTKGDYSSLHPRYWPNLGETRTTFARDLIGNTTISADATPAFDTSGAPSFNGTWSMVTNKSAYVLGLRKVYTITGWVKATSFVNPLNLFSDWTSATNKGITVRISDATKAEFYTYGNNTRLTVNYTFNTNTWYHLAAVNDGANMYMYVNGELAGSSAGLSEILDDSTVPVRIGARGDGVGPAYGTVGSVQAFLTAFNVHEVRSKFNAERGAYGV